MFLKTVARSFTFVVLCQAFITSAVMAGPQDITWDDLVPDEADAVLIDYSQIQNSVDIASLDDFDGDQAALDEYLGYMEEVKTTQANGGDEIDMNLNNQDVKIAGYVTPIEFDGERVVEFFLVPYLGACVHVPPPPANQIIYVKNAEGLSAADLYDPIYLVGKLNTSPVVSAVANVGYSVQQGQVLPFDDYDYEPQRLIEVLE